MSTDTRELRQALEEAQAEVREARRDADERARLEVELLRTQDDLSATKLALAELKKQLAALTAQQKDRAELESEVRRLRAEAEVGLSARQRYERSKTSEGFKTPSAFLERWKAGRSARWFMGVIGVGLMTVGYLNGSLHPAVSFVVGTTLFVWSVTAGTRN